VRELDRNSYAVRMDNMSEEELRERKQKKSDDDLFRNHNITRDQYNQILADQGGVCAICGGIDNNTDSHDRWVVDHIHDTQIIRGLLCHRCNTGLGLFNDNQQSLFGAIGYLQQTQMAIVFNEVAALKKEVEILGV